MIVRNIDVGEVVGGLIDRSNPRALVNSLRSSVVDTFNNANRIRNRLAFSTQALLTIGALSIAVPAIAASVEATGSFGMQSSANSTDTVYFLDKSCQLDSGGSDINSRGEDQVYAVVSAVNYDGVERTLTLTKNRPDIGPHGVSETYTLHRFDGTRRVILGTASTPTERFRTADITVTSEEGYLLVRNPEFSLTCRNLSSGQ